MVRCTNCRFLFEPPTLGLLPDCPQCGDVTVGVVRIEPTADAELSPAQPTFKFTAIKTDSAAR
ncbi:MAG: hypothetical protein ACXVAN_15780 [Polyangia bacterium]